jgi:hypothetical protein
MFAREDRGDGLVSGGSMSRKLRQVPMDNRLSRLSWLYGGIFPKVWNLLWTTLLKLWMMRSLLDCDRQLRLRTTTTTSSWRLSCGCSEPRLPTHHPGK